LTNCADGTATLWSWMCGARMSSPRDTCRGAVNLPLDDLPQAAPRFAGQDVVTVCKSGGRSDMAAQVLDAAGARAWSLTGGTQAWVEAGHPIEQAATR
jgi:rhodanese-related sulfurtransferase